MHDEAGFGFRQLEIAPTLSAIERLQYDRYTRPAVLMLGGERKGLTDEQRSICDHIVRIPMVEGMDSLNVAVAGSLAMYEVFGLSPDGSK
jgi:tRNA G18 (ribose-2'-O)-methylase SpoU